MINHMACKLHHLLGVDMVQEAPICAQVPYKTVRKWGLLIPYPLGVPVSRTIGMAFFGAHGQIDHEVWPFGNHPQNLQKFWQERNPLSPSDFEILGRSVEVRIHRLSTSIALLACEKNDKESGDPAKKTTARVNATSVAILQMCCSATKCEQLASAVRKLCTCCLQDLPRDFLAAFHELNERNFAWKLRGRFSKYLQEKKWASLTQEEMEHLRDGFAAEKNCALKHHVNAEMRRTGASEDHVFPPPIKARVSQCCDVFNELPNDVFSNILSQLECYDLRRCREVCKKWRALADGCFSRLVHFSYPLSFHIMRHTHWLEEDGDFRGGRMLTEWKDAGHGLLNFVIHRCSTLQTLVVDFRVTNMIEEIIKRSPFLINVCINSAGSSEIEDLPTHAEEITMAIRCLNSLVASDSLMSNLGAQHGNASLRVLSLVIPFAEHLMPYLGPTEGSSINEAVTALLETCPNLKVFEMVGSFGLNLDEVEVKSPLNMEYLCLWGDDSEEMTATGITAFLQQCPKLKGLGLRYLLVFVDEHLMRVVSDLDMEFISVSWHSCISSWAKTIGDGVRMDLYHLDDISRTTARCMKDLSKIPGRFRIVPWLCPPLITHPDMEQFLKGIVGD